MVVSETWTSLFVGVRDAQHPVYETIGQRRVNVVSALQV